MISKDDVNHLASLARLALDEEEKERLVKDLAGILSYVSEISEVVTEESGPAPGDLANVMRSDEAVSGGAYSKDILNNAPETERGYLRVRSIL